MPTEYTPFLTPPAIAPAIGQFNNNHSPSSKRITTTADITKPMPHSMEAEKGLLGSILIEPKSVFQQCHRLGPGSFYYPPHQILFAILTGMMAAHRPIDLVTVTQAAIDEGELENVGGPAYLAEIATFVPNGTNAAYYAEIVQQKLALRRLVEVGQDSANKAFSEADSATHLLADLSGKLRHVESILDHRTLTSSFGDMLDMDTKDDPNTVLGRRWLCEGSACLWVGQSGIGKSSLAMQAGMMWAQGRPFFGVMPYKGKKLRSLYIQAENDLGDMAEMQQGVMKKFPIPDSEDKVMFIETMNEMMIFVREAVHTGPEFAAIVARLIEKYKPDLVWIDPLLSYVGDDISKQDVASKFLRNTLNPIALDTGIVWMLLHHTGKPSKDPKAKSGWTDHDFSYDAFGSSELVNWARAVNVLRSLGDGAFELRFAKRGKRAGAHDFGTDPQHPEFTDLVYLRHADEGIYWEQTAPPEAIQEAKRSREEGGKFHTQFTKEQLLEAFSKLKGGRTTTEFRLHCQNEYGISKTTFFRLWHQIKESPLIRVSEGRYYAI